MANKETLEGLVREGRERLCPSLRNPSWLVLRLRRELFRRWLLGLPAQELNVLDIGGRVQPYRPLLAGRIQRYLALDLLPSPLVDVVGRAEQLPVADNQFDLVLCTQVLQYIPEPGTAIAEIYRVLKPGGLVLSSVPSSLPRDADHECWRFLPAGLRWLFARFSHVEVQPEGGTITGFFRTINVCLNIFSTFAAIRAVIRWTVFPPVNLCGNMLEGLASSKNDQFAANYSILARK